MASVSRLLLKVIRNVFNKLFNACLKALGDQDIHAIIQKVKTNPKLSATDLMEYI